MSIHKSVLSEESIEALNLREGMTVVDCTLGGGGHSREILKKIGTTGVVVAIDLDKNAIENFRKNFSVNKNIYLVQDNFANLKNILKDLEIDSVDAILADLGFSSDQMENVERGFSFQKEAPLDMRLDQKQELDAQKVVNEYSEKELEKVLWEYGEEKFVKNIVKKIVARRKEKKIETTTELVEIIKSSIPKRYQGGKINPATKTFQALRIEVNGELKNLKNFLPQAIEVLRSKGRLAVISFHSLEDRIIKNIFRENARGCICPAEFPVCRCDQKPRVNIITRKPIQPSEREIRKNPRSRSAKLRVCEKM